MGNVLMNLGNHIKLNLTEEKAKHFDEQYCALIEKSDTSDVWRQFVIWLLVDEEYGVIRFADSSGGSERRRIIQHVADLYIQNCEDVERWHAASIAAAKSAWSAQSADWSDNDAAAYSASAASWCAAASTGNAARAAAYAADSGATAAVFTADDYASQAAANAYCERMADKLVELINAAPLIK